MISCQPSHALAPSKFILPPLSNYLNLDFFCFFDNTALEWKLKKHFGCVIDCHCLIFFFRQDQVFIFFPVNHSQKLQAPQIRELLLGAYIQKTGNSWMKKSAEKFKFSTERFTHFCRNIMSWEFTYFFRWFFWTEKQNPQTFLLFGCILGGYF